MADQFTVLIQPGTVKITRLADNTVVFSTDYNYLHYDPAGTVNFPCGQTISSLNGNLTWQFNNQQVVIHNTYYAAGPVAFNTYMVPLTALNPTVTPDSFTDVEASNIESPYSVV